jgi:hypothetical protein
VEFAGIFYRRLFLQWFHSQKICSRLLITVHTEAERLPDAPSAQSCFSKSIALFLRARARAGSGACIAASLFEAFYENTSNSPQIKLLTCLK